MSMSPVLNIHSVLANMPVNVISLPVVIKKEWIGKCQNSCPH